MHTGNELKILENNSRPGDPEIINILPVLKDDFVDICFRMLEGNLNQLELRRKATVATYKVPPSYGGFSEQYPKFVGGQKADTPIDLAKAYERSRSHPDEIRVYPGSMERCDGKYFSLKSRTVCAVGIADDIEKARSLSLETLRTIRGGALWNRTDIASRSHINKSKKHLEKLRGSR
jgi:phosphoribosylamine--glycine ligase